MFKVKTVLAPAVTAAVLATGVQVNDANVIKTDVMASNGVTHVIDTVVVPN
jgi:uncharacterized surface protein with fasciclin (FAS1) repeats